MKAKAKTWEGQHYHFMGCYSGTLNWSCPYCGQVQSSKVGKRAWHLQCRASDCRRKIIFCFLLKPAGKPRRKGVLPRDMMVELAPIPVDRPMGFGAYAPVHVMAKDGDKVVTAYRE